MSSILKSLKKLENETERSLLSASPPVFNSRQTLRREITSRRRVRTWALSLITVGVLVGGGWLLMRSRPVPAPSLTASPSSPAVMKAEQPTPGLRVVRPPAPLPGESLVPEKRSPEQRVREVIAARSPHSSQRPAKSVLPERTDMVDATDIQNPGKNDLPPSQRMAENRLAPSPIAPERAPSPTVPAPAKPPTAPTTASELPPLSADAGLKLEALAWSSVPENRFVVINSQIIREGEIIEGIKVERIEREQVVLRKDGKLWQLRHRPQR